MLRAGEILAEGDGLIEALGDSAGLGDGETLADGAFEGDAEGLAEMLGAPLAGKEYATEPR